MKLIRTYFWLSCFISSSSMVGNLVAEPSSPWLSFEESDVSWVVERWAPGGVATEITKKHATHGTNAARLIFTGKTPAIDAAFTLKSHGDLGNTGKMVFDFYNDSRLPLTIALALQTGEALNWHETLPRELKPGLNRDVEFVINQPDFKSEITGWEHKTHLMEADNVKALTLKLPDLTHEQTGALYLDNIRLVSGKPREIKAAEKKAPLYLETIDPKQYQKPIISVASAPKEVAKFAKVEIALSLAAYYKNPFNPEEIRLQLQVKSPSGKTHEVKGFFYEGEYSEKKTAQDNAKSTWLIRFTPDLPGIWKGKINAENPAGKVTSVPFSIKVTDNKSSGFVRTIDKRVFRDDAGAPFVPVGINVAWVIKEDQWNYEKYLQEVATNGGNFIRIWLTSWSDMIFEWGIGPDYHGIGRYNLANAKKLDRLVEQAESLGIKIQLCLEYHDNLDEKRKWSASAYNELNGGPVKDSIDFFSNKDAKAYFKRYIGYLIARYGYSTSIFSWELFNEINWVTKNDSKLEASWHKEMGDFIKKEPHPNRHFVTTSFNAYNTLDKSSTWGLKEIDYVQTHFYANNFAETTDIVASWKSFDKPHIFGETGASLQNPQDELQDKEGVIFRESLFSPLLSPDIRSTGMYWWWDSAVKELNHFRYLKVVRKLIDAVDITSERYKSAKISVETAGTTDLFMYPILDWEKNIDDVFTISPEGPAKPYIFSRYHFAKPVGFGGDKKIAMETVREVELAVSVVQVAEGAASNLTIRLNGKIVQDNTFKPGSKVDREFAIKVPAGKHTVELENRGEDWYRLQYIRISDMASKVYAKGLADETSGVFWLRSRDFNLTRMRQAKRPPTISDAIVRISGLRDGLYNLTYFDAQGTVEKSATANSIKGELKFQAEPFSQDLLIVVRRAK